MSCWGSPAASAPEHSSCLHIATEREYCRLQTSWLPLIRWAWYTLTYKIVLISDKLNNNASTWRPWSLLWITLTGRQTIKVRKDKLKAYINSHILPVISNIFNFLKYFILFLKCNKTCFQILKNNKIILSNWKTLPNVLEVTRIIVFKDLKKYKMGRLL